jgi:alkylhydroperoxidase family enzyme
MARVSLLSNEQAPPEIREMFQKIEANGFRVINLYRVMAHCPRVGRYFLRLGNSILFKGAVPPNLRELAILRVGNIYQANYEFTQHVPIALRTGVKREQIDALPDWEKSGKFSEQERAILRYTDEVTKNIRVKDDTFAGVRSFLSEEGIVELTTTIGYYGMVSRILEAFQVELES